MNQKQYRNITILLILIGLFIGYEIITDSFKSGDFIGYVNAGNLVLNHKNIYSDYLNTWPPLFSVFSVVLTVGDGISSVIIRLLWLMGSLLSLYFIIQLTVNFFYGKTITFKKNGSGMLFQNAIIFVPFLIILRFLLDNLANIQINIYILLATVLSIIFFIRKKYFWAGLFLGLTISLKVYTIFFLFYFIYKREFKLVWWTIFVVILLNSVTFIVFGFDKAIYYYQHWILDIAPQSYISNHKNQSIFGAMLRFFTTEDPDHNLYVNILSINPKTIKMVTYGIITLVSLFPAFLFRKKLKNTSSISALIEYSVIFTSIPILSPLSWKAYFIFLWVPYFLLYSLLFKSKNQLSLQINRLLKGLFWLSIVLNVFSTEAIVGVYFSDVMESFSALTFGTVILLLIQFYIYQNLDKFDYEISRG